MLTYICKPIDAYLLLATQTYMYVYMYIFMLLYSYFFFVEMPVRLLYVKHPHQALTAPVKIHPAARWRHTGTRATRDLQTNILDPWISRSPEFSQLNWLVVEPYPSEKY